jgi:hypothetical protein
MESMKDDERDAFNVFCNVMGLTVDDFKEVDPPDFVAKDGTLAIELVEYHKDSNKGKRSQMRRAEETAKNVVIAAKRKYYEHPGNLPMDAFLYRSRYWDRNENLERVADDIAVTVAKHQGQDLELRFAYERPPHPLTRKFDLMIVSPTPEYQFEPLWQICEAAILDINLKSIDTLLVKKNTKLSTYRKVAPEVWLVIYGSPLPCVGIPSRANPSTCGMITNSFRIQEFHSDFNHVYYLDRAHEEVLRLNSKHVVED